MLVIPTESTLYTTLRHAAQIKRMIFLVGLPGTGKSLLIQQLALIASDLRRTIHLMQYDVARQAFETPEALAKYPEIDGVTHPAVRKAVGLWSRNGVQTWHEQYAGDEHLLIGELPLMGSRLIELVQPLDDTAEPLLSSDQALYLIAVPSIKVRTAIEAARAKTIANPQHERENRDAPPHVLRALWRDVSMLAELFELAMESEKYAPRTYEGVYKVLLQHRPTQTLLIEELLKPSGSVYDLDVVASELCASVSAAARILREVEEGYTPQELVQAVERWYEYALNAPQ